MKTILLSNLIHPANLTLDVLALIHIIGNTVEVYNSSSPVYYTEDFTEYYKFPNASNMFWLSISDNDCTAAVTKAQVIEGHLVLTAHFDDGESHFSFTKDCRFWEANMNWYGEELLINNISISDVKVTCNLSVVEMYNML
jgi:hypothetical protein